MDSPSTRRSFSPCSSEDLWADMIADTEQHEFSTWQEVLDLVKLRREELDQNKPVDQYVTFLSVPPLEWSRLWEECPFPDYCRLTYSRTRRILRVKVLDRLCEVVVGAISGAINGQTRDMGLEGELVSNP